jgi:hypothetical protein
MWGSYTNQSSGLSTPNSPVLTQSSQGFIPTSQNADSEDSYSSSSKAPKTDKKPWNWPLIAAGLGAIGIMAVALLSRGKFKNIPTPITPPLSGSALTPERITTDAHNAFSSKDFPVIEAVEGFKILPEERQKVIQSYVKVPKAFRELTEKDKKKVFLVNGGVTNAPSMEKWRGKATWDGRKYDDVGGVSDSKGAVISVDLVEHRLESTVLHELGHNVDHSLGDISSQKEWQKLYNECKDLKSHERDGNHAHFLSRYCRGRSDEFFAQCFFYYYSSLEKRARLPKNIQHYFAALEKKHSDTPTNIKEWLKSKL